MYDQLVQFHIEHAATIKALLAGTMVSAVCSLVGCFIVLRRMSFMADALSHSMVAGVIGGYLIVKLASVYVFRIVPEDYQATAMIIGAMIAGFVTVGMISFVTRVSRVKNDTAIGIMYTGIFALGGFVASMRAVSGMIHFHLYDLVVGDVLAVRNGQLWMMAGVMVLVVVCILLFYRSFQMVSFDPVMAASIGIPVLAVDYLMTACTSLVVVSGVNIAGVILVVALVITPAASAYLLFDRLKRMLFAAAAFGVVGFWLGYFVSTWTGTTPGPAIVLTMTIIFLATLFFAPRYGLIADWLRRASTVPQQTKEDVLGFMMRGAKRIPVTEIVTRADGHGFSIRRAVRKLDRQGLLEVRDGFASLTGHGEKEAVRLLRAHRLWETYLQKLGTPEEKVHKIAHQLEHVSDEATVEYLDDQLGHPIRDPHGSEIPPDFEHLRVGKIVRVSLLRKGHRARIHRLRDQSLASKLQIESGLAFVVGPRVDDGQAWTLILTDGRQIKLNHQQADAIEVEMLPPDANDPGAAE